MPTLFKKNVLIFSRSRHTARE